MPSAKSNPREPVGIKGISSWINDGNNISSKLNESNSITIASWIKPTYPNNTTTHNRTLFSTAVGYYGDLSLYVPDYDNTDNKIQLQHSQAYETNEQIIRPNETGWLHVAATSENGLQSIYLNGIKRNARNLIKFKQSTMSWK